MIYELERMILEEALDGEQIYTRINNLVEGSKNLKFLII